MYEQRRCAGDAAVGCGNFIARAERAWVHGDHGREVLMRRRYGGCLPPAGQVVIQQEEIRRVQVGAHEYHRLCHSMGGLWRC